MSIATGTPPCQSMCGSGIDAAVAALVLDTLTPLAMQTALAVSAELTDRAADADRIRAASVERARYTADAARRRHLAVDPANRLVADTLEADWNHKLRELADAQDDYDRARQAGAGTLTAEQQTRIRNLPALWHDPATPMRERKRLIRLLVTDVTPAQDRRAGHRPRPPARRAAAHPDRAPAADGLGQHTTPEDTVALIDELLADHTYDQTAAILNQARTHRRLGQTVHRRLAHSAVPPAEHPQPAPTAARRGHAHPRRDRR